MNKDLLYLDKVSVVIKCCSTIPMDFRTALAHELVNFVQLETVYLGQQECSTA